MCETETVSIKEAWESVKKGEKEREFVTQKRMRGKWESLAPLTENINSCCVEFYFNKLLHTN